MLGSFSFLSHILDTASRVPKSGNRKEPILEFLSSNSGSTGGLNDLKGSMKPGTASLFGGSGADNADI